MTSLRLVIATLALAACGGPDSNDPGDGPMEDTGPLTLSSVEPKIGSVGGGTKVTIEGAGLRGAKVAIGGVECGSAMAESTNKLTCQTGNADFHEGSVDVVVTRASERAVLVNAYTYECLWTTSSGRKSCGAAPPGVSVAEQMITSYVTKFEDQHGFSMVTPGAANLADTSDHVLGTQSVSFDTDGFGTQAIMQRGGMTPMNFTDQFLKIWVKVDNVAHLASLDVYLGSGPSNVYKFRLRSSQGQQWMTNGDWVAFTVSFSPENYGISGSPNRAAITDIQIRASDDATGSPVRVHLNGLAMVPEPVDRFPNGVLTFSFDDNWASQMGPYSLLEEKGFAGTAYVIVDMVGHNDRLTLSDLQSLQTAGWDVAAHSYTDLHHYARFTTLPYEVVEDDMVDSRNYLIKNGFKAYDQCAYPGGDFTGGADVLGLAGKYFASCRTVFSKQTETYPPPDARKLRVLLVTGPTSLVTVEQAVDDARANREWLILVFHKFAPTAADNSTWAEADFTALVEHVAASGIAVKPLGSVLAQ
jgi:hypothetical protein